MADNKFEAENDKKIRERHNKNILKWYGVKCSDEVYYVGSPDLQDPYSGAPIYLPSEQYLIDLEEKERKAREQIESGEYESAEDISSDSNDTSTDDGVFDSKGMSDEELQLANEIYQRLMNEAAADEMAKQAEIEAIKQQVEATDADYNAETGSYSGLYGKKPMNDEEADALASIMNSNNSYNKSFDDLLEESKNQQN